MTDPHSLDSPVSDRTMVPHGTKEEAMSDLDQTVAGDAASGSPSRTAPEELGKYHLKKLLGRGGMGAVYLGFDTVLEREVAIKILPPEIASRTNTLNRFLAEAKATGKLNHPHVVAIYDLGQVEDQYYFVMEVIRGGSVADLIESSKGIPWQTACELIAQAADGLAAAHAVGLVHRDIKPENLMLTPEQQVKVVDFGVSKLVDEEAALNLTAAGQLLGTPHYMSPEQIRTGEIDARSDIYNLGATFYRLLTAQYPFPHCKTITQVLMAHMEEPAPKPSASDPAIPVACDQIIERAMAKDRSMRFQTAAELAASLRAVISVSQPDSAQVTSQEPAARASGQLLKSVMILEPSRMQAMMLRKTFEKQGVISIQTPGTLAEALEELNSSPADLLITAQQLSDGVGIDLVRQIRQQPRWRGLPVVLSSNDLTMEGALEVSPEGEVGVASKKVHPEEIMRGVLAATGLRMESAFPQEARPLQDLSSQRLLLICDSEAVPESCAAMLRELQIFDVSVVNSRSLEAGSALSGKFQLVIWLRDKPVSSSFDRSMLGNVKKIFAANGLEEAAAAVVVHEKEVLQLRLIHRHGFTFATDRPFDTERLRQLAEIVGS